MICRKMAFSKILLSIGKIIVFLSEILLHILFGMFSFKEHFLNKVNLDRFVDSVFLFQFQIRFSIFVSDKVGRLVFRKVLCAKNITISSTKDIT